MCVPTQSTSGNDTMTTADNRAGKFGGRRALRDTQTGGGTALEKLALHRQVQKTVRFQPANATVSV